MSPLARHSATWRDSSPSLRYTSKAGPLPSLMMRVRTRRCQSWNIVGGLCGGCGWSGRRMITSGRACISACRLAVSAYQSTANAVTARTMIEPAALASFNQISSPRAPRVVRNITIPMRQPNRVIISDLSICQPVADGNALFDHQLKGWHTAYGACQSTLLLSSKSVIVDSACFRCTPDRTTTVSSQPITARLLPAASLRDTLGLPASVV